PAAQCQVAGLRDLRTGLCPAAVARQDGTTCNDGNACTIGDTCQAGGCIGVNSCSGSSLFADIADLGPTAAGDETVASGIDQQGDVVGVEVDPIGRATTWRYSDDGGFQPFASGGARTLWGLGINVAGVVAGFTSPDVMPSDAPMGSRPCSARPPSWSRPSAAAPV